MARIDIGPAPPLEKLRTDSLGVDARTENLAAVGEFVRGFALEAGFGEKESGMVELALDELATNSIVHGYAGAEEGRISIEAATIPGGIAIVLEEEGGSFDPSAVVDPDLEAGLDDREVGGLGLFFVRQIMDEIYYETTDSGLKRFTLIKKRGGE